MAQHSLGVVRSRTEETEEVECSCGAKTTIFYSRALQRFLANNPKWKYRQAVELKRGERMGWYCGKEGHNPCEESGH